MSFLLTCWKVLEPWKCSTYLGPPVLAGGRNASRLDAVDSLRATVTIPKQGPQGGREAPAAELHT